MATDPKSTFIRHMFGRIAQRYDLMNRLMTFGLDQGWRRRVVAEARVPKGGRALDVATGTGDIALAFQDTVKVVGLDFCPPMLAIAREKAAGRKGKGFVIGDALALPFPDDCFDAVTSGFAMRNVPDMPLALTEMHRVTRPGGRMVCLEVARPQRGLLGALYGFYFRRIVPILGGIVSGHSDAYAYLPASADRFPLPPELKAAMEAAGWHNVYYVLLALGAVAIHVGIKERTG